MAGKNKNHNNKNKDENLMKEVCLVCNGKVGDNDKGISCEMCGYWFHAKCIKMKNELYDFYTKKETTWVCTVCVKAAKEENKMREVVSEMMEMHEKTRSEVKKERDEAVKDRAELTEIMKIMMVKIDELAKCIETKIDEKMKTVEKDILGKVNEEIDQKL